MQEQRTDQMQQLLQKDVLIKLAYAAYLMGRCTYTQVSALLLAGHSGHICWQLIQQQLVFSNQLYRVALTVHPTCACAAVGGQAVCHDVPAAAGRCYHWPRGGGIAETRPDRSWCQGTPRDVTVTVRRDFKHVAQW
jgi:hypothetical protein